MLFKDVYRKLYFSLLDILRIVEYIRSCEGTSLYFTSYFMLLASYFFIRLCAGLCSRDPFSQGHY